MDKCSDCGHSVDEHDESGECNHVSGFTGCCPCNEFAQKDED